MYEYDDIITERPQTTATKRYRRGEIPGQREQAQLILNGMGDARPRRATQYQDEAPRGDVYQGPQRRRAGDAAEDTWSDEKIRAPRPRTTTTQRTYAAPRSKLKKQPSTRQKQQKHPAFYVGATALVLVGGWLATTWGASAWTANLSYPSTYGPMHGTVISTTLGGDSKAHPSKIIGWNDDGKVEILVLIADNPRHTQIIAGPDLRAASFPDPTGSEVQLEAGDFNHDGHTDIRVHILSTEFDYPFHPHQQYIDLDGDGKGNLKQTAGGQ